LESGRRREQKNGVTANSSMRKLIDTRKRGSDGRLFYVVDWLPPDFGAVGQYAAILARDLASQGRDVRLIGLTSGDGRTITEFLPGGGFFEITYVSSPLYQKSDNLKRLLWTIRTNFRLINQVFLDKSSYKSELVFTGAPPFMLFFAAILKFVLRVSLTYRITDFYPEVVIAEFGRRAWLVAAQRVTWVARRLVDRFEVLGEDQRALLIAGGIAADRIRLKRDVSPVTIRDDTRPAACPGSLRDYKILLYSGNYSVAHDVETVVEGLIRHHGQGRGSFGLWLNATGSKADIVEQRLRAANIPMARSGPVSLDELPGLLLAAGVHLISLRPQFSGIVLPSKVYGCIASRRPILFVGPASSDVHPLCCQADLPAYERVEPGDVVGFAAALDRLGQRIIVPVP
jgi:hypothetical protein